MKKRKLTQEILDELPAGDPEAIRSRRDLRLVNLAMGNYNWLAEKLRRGPQHWIELGAGEGVLADQVHSRNDKVVTGVDLAPRPSNWPEIWPWEQRDLFDFLSNNESQAQGIAANLFLHHFDHEQLGEIGRLIPDNVHHLVFSEPARYKIHQWQGRLGFPLFNRVTRHDMLVSIEAGFREDELARALRLDPVIWRWEQSNTFIGAYRFEARRIGCMR